MGVGAVEKKKLKVYFNSTKNEVLANESNNYTKFIKNFIRNYASVHYYFLIVNFIIIDSLDKNKNEI